eukprot:m.44131 g.44131  ORF g.44131 m.44131 type:complete len:53 (-) comp7148_c0_seq1:2076-2234(-)
MHAWSYGNSIPFKKMKIVNIHELFVCTPSEKTKIQSHSTVCERVIVFVCANK